jgi:hypothetical protein
MRCNEQGRVLSRRRGALKRSTDLSRDLSHQEDRDDDASLTEDQDLCSGEPPSGRRQFVSSSGTRLTDEFRYLLDMINIVFWSGGSAPLLTASGHGVGVKARPAGRPRSGVVLTPTPTRRILAVAGPPVRGGEGAMFFGPVVPDRMDADDLVIAGQLDRLGDDAHLHRPAAPAVADR